MLARAFASAALKRAAQASAGDAGLAVRTFRAPPQQLAGLALKQGLAAAAAPAAGLGVTAAGGSLGLKAAIGAFKTSALPHLSFASAGIACGVAAALAVSQTAAAEAVLENTDNLKPSGAASIAASQAADSQACRQADSGAEPAAVPRTLAAQPAEADLKMKRYWTMVGRQLTWFAFSAAVIGGLAAAGHPVAAFFCLFIWSVGHFAINEEHVKERINDFLRENNVQQAPLVLMRHGAAVIAGIK